MIATYKFEFMGWTVRMTEQDLGWWRAHAVRSGDAPMPIIIYDNGLEKATQRIMEHINDTEDALCQSA